MRGVSAGTRDAVLLVVEEQVRDGADAAALGDDLFAVVDVLDSAPSLRRMLTNPSSANDAKKGLVESLFADKIGAPALKALATAAAGRWNAARDLAHALEAAGVEAHLTGAEQAGELEEAEDELFGFGRLVHGDPDLRAALSDRRMPVARKRELVASLLEGKVRSSTSSLVGQAVAARQRSFELTLDDFVQITAGRRDQLVATVRVAYDLDETERARLASALQGLYGTAVHVNVIVEPALLGGATIEIGDEIIDSSVAGRLEHARRKMAG
ncbi:MAG: F0F1 ATP synthase subunit delta [Actinomycetota bacterium]|nr:F0F1 ATP synthase subunit delta [Actinomycetota bacterium]